MNVKLRWLIPAGVLLGSVCFYGGLVAARTTSSAELEWKLGGQTLHLNVAKDLSNPEVMFGKLFASEFSRAGTLELLRAKGVFSVDDMAMVDALNRLCPPDVPRESWLKRQQRLSKCFEEKFLLQRLRGLADKHQAPFQYVGRDVLVATPPGDALSRGVANVCSSGDFVGRKLQLVNPNGSAQVTVQASGVYTCTVVTVADVQICSADARDLFNRPTGKLERAIAVVLKD